MRKIRGTSYRLLLNNRQRPDVPGPVGFHRFGLGFILTRLHLISEAFPPARSPFLDASVAGLMLTAQVLAAQKKWECWVFWIALNIGNVILYISAGLVFMPIVAAFFLAFNVIGIIHWNREWKKQKQIC